MFDHRYYLRHLHCMSRRIYIHLAECPLPFTYKYSNLCLQPSVWTPCWSCIWKNTQTRVCLFPTRSSCVKFCVSKFNEHTDTIISWKKIKRALSRSHNDWISKSGQTRVCLRLTRSSRAEFHVSNFNRYRDMVIF